MLWRSALMIFLSLVALGCGPDGIEHASHSSLTSRVNKAMTLLKSRSVDDRTTGLVLLRGKKYASPQVARACIHLLSDADDIVRWHAAWTLSSLGKFGASSVNDLKALLSDESPFVISGAATALGRLRRYIGSEAVAGELIVPILVRRLSEYPEFSPEVAYALSAFGEEARAAAPLVVKCMDDDHNVWQYCYALAAFNVRSKSVIDVLRQVVSDAGADILARLYAIEALGKFGPDASAALDDLRRVQKIWDLSDMAAEAIDSIQR